MYIYICIYILTSLPLSSSLSSSSPFSITTLYYYYIIYNKSPLEKGKKEKQPPYLLPTHITIHT